MALFLWNTVYLKTKSSTGSDFKKTADIQLCQRHFSIQPPEALCKKKKKTGPDRLSH